MSQSATSDVCAVTRRGWRYDAARPRERIYGWRCWLVRVRGAGRDR